MWAQKEYHKRAITSMEGALSFARRALACKEDMELLALCAQVTIKMEMLSQLKSDSQNTEKIEMKNVKFKETNEQETDTVGDIHVQTFTPDIKIRTTELQKRVPFSEGCSITFQVTAAVNFKCKTPKLTASAIYTALYYDYEYGQDTYKCTMKKMLQQTVGRSSLLLKNQILTRLHFKSKESMEAQAYTKLWTTRSKYMYIIVH